MIGGKRLDGEGSSSRRGLLFTSATLTGAPASLGLCRRCSWNSAALTPRSCLPHAVDDRELDLIHRQKDIHQFQEVVEGISHLLERDSMKVVFVGHTSNGKSTVINSMLYDIVLPMGIGHTTYCFCSVEGTTSEPYMLKGDSPEKHEITTVKQVCVCVYVCVCACVDAWPAPLR